MAYKTFNKNEKPAYWSISKRTIRGHHIATPFRSKPMEERGQIIVSGTKLKLPINESGYAKIKNLPSNITQLKPKKYKRQQPFSNMNFGNLKFGW